jgi:hypothetical protein
MRLILISLFMLIVVQTSAQIIGRKSSNLYLYQYNPKTKDGTLLFEIDCRMVGVIESITIQNRKRFRQKKVTIYLEETDYIYIDQDGFIVRIQLGSMRNMIGRFSDTATVDITVYKSGHIPAVRKTLLLNRTSLLKSNFINFR